MTRTTLTATDSQAVLRFASSAGHSRLFYLGLLLWWLSGGHPTTLSAQSEGTQPPPAATTTGAGGTNAVPHYEVQGYVVLGNTLLSTNTLTAIFAGYTGADVGMDEIVKAAAALQTEYQKQGGPAMSVAVPEKLISHGIVTMYLFQAPEQQILVSGRRYVNATNETQVAANPSGTGATTNAPAETKTNTGPLFVVRAYEIRGDNLLSTPTLTSILVKYTGTNVSLADITQAAADLQLEYRRRSYPTVSVTIPQQQITNGIVKFRVFEGVLSEIDVVKNRYFSSNNIMRALPSLHTNMIMSGAIFQAELDRANANQDRQIYPQIEPGPEPNTTILTLQVKDRLPLHGKLELNNQSSPGTPDLRINASAVYNNLWQHEHSLGLQYGFSPEKFKSVPPLFSHLNTANWEFYDQPLVANYSAFYRMPLGNPEAVADVVANNPNNFGYDEATRKFNLPPPSGQPELTVYGSRSTVDTGLTALSDEKIFETNGYSLIREIVQQDLTVNNNLGTRLTVPLPRFGELQSGISGGVDYKTYNLVSYKTNNFFFRSEIIDQQSNQDPPPTNVSVSDIASPVPTTVSHVDYLPLSLRYDGSVRDSLGSTAFGLGVSGNFWYTGSRADLQNITGSSESTGHWLVLTPSVSRNFTFRTNWVLSLRADGQWASEPLISNEQFGAGGVASVRGYREGEVFGDTGWHISAEQQTPPHIVGRVYGNTPLIIRGSVYMDYATVYLLDPQGRKESTSLWGTGFGGVASVGTAWEARFLFSLPLLSTTITERYQPRFNFVLTAQF